MSETWTGMPSIGFSAHSSTCTHCWAAQRRGKQPGAGELAGAGLATLIKWAGQSSRLGAAWMQAGMLGGSGVPGAAAHSPLSTQHL